ncbi:DUF2778 domain-containing protein [Cupriavidus agavae]|uniref:Uncharacterized protein DUF2778 n=1 Tax=Cupriavidus agavae TaxID=1001822 RepID=A0A4Q7S766_9BURK|nr:DUF2778 domain-containing protein [Cupriavidus agavae]RZT42241.1 uncharacterized protein DUF2778 [Cupriavidus agavae]
MAVVTHSLVREIEGDPILRRALAEAHRAKFGLVARTTDVRLMVEMLGLEETARRIESRYARLDFDGKVLRWIENGMASRSWLAVSGALGYQHKRYQDVPNKGPIPEGFYVARQAELQRREDYAAFNRVICHLGGVPYLKKFSGAWPGCGFAWGDRRIWLEPLGGSSMLGRNNFSIHGGSFPASAGCIDLTSDMPDFVDKFLKYGKDLELRVRY